LCIRSKTINNYQSTTGAFYHITCRGNERKAVFKSKQDRVKFLEYLGSATEGMNYLSLGKAFVLVPDIVGQLV
jgi:REP element-mobilizing transposase RayT